MKITQEELSEYIEYIKIIPQLKPIIKELVETLADIGSEIKPVFKALMLGFAGLELEVFNFYIKSGLTREEALTLTLNIKDSVFKMSINNKK